MRTVVSPKKHGVSAIAAVVSSRYNYYCMMWTILCYNKILSRWRRETTQLAEDGCVDTRKVRADRIIYYIIVYNLFICAIVYACDTAIHIRLWIRREKITILYDIIRYLWVSCALATLSCVCVVGVYMNRVRTNDGSNRFCCHVDILI